MLRTIRLYGELGKKYGKVHRLHVTSVAEAIRALSANFKDFKQHLIDSDKRIAGYEVWDGKHNLSQDDVDSFNLHSNSDIKIIPRVKGSSNVGRIIVGIVLLVIAYWTGGATAGSAMAYLSQAAFAMGSSLLLSGVIGMMTKSSSGSSIDSDTENTESYIFSGPVNTTKQGSPIRIGYGKMIVGSQVISASLTTADIPID